MIILGIETATPHGGAALWRDGRVMSEEINDGAVSHSQRLMPAIDRILKQCGCSLSEISGIAVSIGPGSFTGLRIGLSIAKTLAHAEKKPIVAIPTLEALAWRFASMSSLPGRHLLAPMLDARRNEIFACIFRLTEDPQTLERISPDVVERPEVFVRCLEVGMPILAGGSGATRYETLMKEHLGQNLLLAENEGNLPSAAMVAELGAKKLAAGETANVLTLEPVYVRKSDAELSAAHRLSKK